jgi:hypothetical protein
MKLRMMVAGRRKGPSYCVTLNDVRQFLALTDDWRGDTWVHCFIAGYGYTIGPMMGPEKQRNASLLPLLHNYQKPSVPINGSMAPTGRFRAAVQDAKVGPDKDIPHITPQIIAKYVSDLRLLGLL